MILDAMPPFHPDLAVAESRDHHRILQSGQPPPADRLLDRGRRVRRKFGPRPAPARRQYAPRRTHRPVGVAPDPLGDVSARVEHVGSTAVEGLAAKPIVDIMVGLEDFSLADGLVPKVEALGYEYVKKFEEVMPFRRFFTKERDGARTHQIHVVAVGCEFWERLILFRDFLRKNPEIAAKYASLKKELAGREWGDVDEYADAKTEFVRGIEEEASGSKRKRETQRRHGGPG